MGDVEVLSYWSLRKVVSWQWVAATRCRRLSACCTMTGNCQGGVQECFWSLSKSAREPVDWLGVKLRGTTPFSLGRVWRSLLTINVCGRGGMRRGLSARSRSRQDGGVSTWVKSSEGHWQEGQCRGRIGRTKKDTLPRKRRVRVRAMGRGGQHRHWFRITGNMILPC